MDTNEATGVLSDVISLLIDDNSDLPPEDMVTQEVPASDTPCSSVEFSDLKDGIYSIVYAGLASGWEYAENSEDFTIDEAWQVAKAEALSKAKETVPDYLCNHIQTKVSTSFSNKRAAIENKNYKNNFHKNADIFLTDSTETLANKSVANFRGVLDGELSVAEAIENSMTETVSEVSEQAIDKFVSNASDKLGFAKYFDPQELMGTAKNVKDCFVQYLNGEITDAQFYLKIGQDGLFHVAQGWGASIGTSIAISSGLQGVAAAVTAAASATIVTAVFCELYKYALHVFEEEVASEQRLNAIRILSQEAITVIRKERETLLHNAFIQTGQRQRVFLDSLNTLDTALNTQDIDKMIAAMNAITLEVGGSVQFKTFEETRDAMLDDSFVFVL